MRGRRSIQVIPLARCEICQGKGVIKGIFHEMECAGCNGAGLVDEVTSEALSHQQMVQQLRVRLNRANRLLGQQQEQLERAGLIGGPAQDYAGQNNWHHRGGGNWTGD